MKTNNTNQLIFGFNQSSNNWNYLILFRIRNGYWSYCLFLVELCQESVFCNNPWQNDDVTYWKLKVMYWNWHWRLNDDSKRRRVLSLLKNNSKLLQTTSRFFTVNDESMNTPLSQMPVKICRTNFWPNWVTWRKNKTWFGEMEIPVFKPCSSLTIFYIHVAAKWPGFSLSRVWLF